MPSPTLSIKTIHRDHAVILRPEGELDLCTSGALVAAFRRAARGAPARIELDASRLTFIDIAGMRAVMECRRAARGAGARFALRHPSRAMREMLGLLHLHEAAGLGAPLASASRPRRGTRRPGAPARPAAAHR